MRQDDNLKELIDWEAIMPMPRYAGGHDDQMCGLFRGSTLIAHYNEGDYQGVVATCVKLEDGRFVIYNDYYGSCSGCDAWEDASDEDVRAMCINLANSAKIFDTLDEVKDYLNLGSSNDNYSWGEVGLRLLEEMQNENTN